MNAFIVFSGLKRMGNDISLIILVILENFQDIQDGRRRHLEYLVFAWVEEKWTGGAL